MSEVRNIHPTFIGSLIGVLSFFFIMVFLGEKNRKEEKQDA